MPLIKCSNLCVSYDNLCVVKDVSFKVESGDYLCIVGENGSGKTTLTKAILGLIGSSSGTVEFFDGLKKNEIGYLPQQTEIQKDFPASIKEVVLSGCLNKKKWYTPFYTQDDKSLAAKNIHRLGLCELLNSSYHELSGGQKQRVLLARALCATQKLIVLDEPAAGLDPVITAEFYDVVSSLNKEDGITVIMISHDMSCVKKYASHILHLGDNDYYFGDKESYFLSDVYLRYMGGKNQ